MLCWTEQTTCCIAATVLLFSHIHRHVLAMVGHNLSLLKKIRIARCSIHKARQGVKPRAVDHQQLGARLPVDLAYLRALA
ncbi:MAG: hypothetical protein J2P37_22995 [Ktedonobacteraceae bacterium]|nr:hypothetical protein [Ktedonobacteraceae bacterium]MBO0789901.1 hypothetical protein [Ktedonobacteraceae bacterium]